MEKVAPWEPVNASDPEVRVLDIEPRVEKFREREQCKVLEMPLDYYDD